MRIVGRKEFLSMPSGTIFSKFGRGHIQYGCDHGCGNIAIKCSTYGSDYAEQPLGGPFPLEGDGSDYSEIYERAAADSTFSFTADYDCAGRDGLFDQHQRFLIWERADVLAMISRLHLEFDQAYPAPPSDI